MNKPKTIQAIETVYNGYRFRSRLEARWAIFFDAMGIAYEYEPEGFELADGTWYLPDFKLDVPLHNYEKGVTYSLWVEVKPEKLDAAERKKCLLLATGLQADVLILIGSPNFNTYELLTYDEATDGVFSSPILFDEEKYGIYYGGDAIGEPSDLFADNPIQQDAICRARQARFEHGQTPN